MSADLKVACHAVEVWDPEIAMPSNKSICISKLSDQYFVCVYECMRMLDDMCLIFGIIVVQPQEGVCFSVLLFAFADFLIRFNSSHHHPKVAYRLLVDYSFIMLPCFGCTSKSFPYNSGMVDALHGRSQVCEGNSGRKAFHWRANPLNLYALLWRSRYYLTYVYALHYCAIYAAQSIACNLGLISFIPSLPVAAQAPLW
jgi:hypothetical protein